LGDITLGSDKIKTGLCVVAKRADTNSTWPLINHPAGKYFNTAIGQNHTIPLWRAVRASAAAPTYFTPQVIEVGGDMSEAAFVDGGVSMANSPSLQMLMVATLKGFPFHWPMGKDNILIVSVGTGNSKNKQLPSQITKGMAIKWASSVPNMLMQDASFLNQVMLQWMSDSPTALSINGEIGKLEDDILGLGDKPDALISYLRYNTFMTIENLGKLMGKTYTQAEVDYLVEMSHADNRYVLYDIGAKAGEVEIMPDHFPEHFKIK
jgi:patatin-like phospholipase/acyl hydrolase